MSYSNPEVEAFHKAVFRGKKKEVKALLNDKVIVGTRSDGISALHIVASTGSTRICKLLLPGMNGSLELRESHGATALNIACQNGHSGVCKLLLEAGADVNAGRADHVTPLYIAAQEGHSKIVQVLLQFRVDVAYQRPSGASALFVAAQKGRAKVVEMLVSAGAPVNVSVDRVTALEAAVRANHMRCSQILIAAKARIEIGGPDVPLDESEALKWVEKALHCLEEAEEHFSEEPDETHKLMLFSKLGAVKKKDLAGMSKKELREKYASATKTLSKLDNKIQLARNALVKERDESRRQINNWKMAFMMSSAGYTLPQVEEKKPEPEVGEQQGDSGDEA